MSVKRAIPAGLDRQSAQANGSYRTREPHGVRICFSTSHRLLGFVLKLDLAESNFVTYDHGILGVAVCCAAHWHYFLT